MISKAYSPLLSSFVTLAMMIASTNAFWRLPCGSPVVRERIDPIISPEKVASHFHTVMGGNAMDFSMTYNDTQEATCSSCKVIEDNSNYWTPGVFFHAKNGSFIPVPQTGGGLIYYLQRDDPKDPLYGKEGLLAFPDGFRMVAGNMRSRNYTNTQEQNAVSWACLAREASPQTPQIPNNAASKCVNGLRSQVVFPSCWNGKDVDSPDHKSHMSYPEGNHPDGGPCPSDFPHRFITLFYEISWEVDKFEGEEGFNADQPFVLSQGDPVGTGFHGDFLNGWVRSTLQDAVTNCNDLSGDVLKCPFFHFREDADMNACRVDVRVHEQTTGVLSALPGCNPVQSGPEEATLPGNDCGATTEIGDPILSYTDVTASNGWRYLGCMNDPAGASRTLGNGGPSLSGDNMTVDSCVDHCAAQGSQYAGVEFASQCFCGSEWNESRRPAKGLQGQCTMACSGNSTQICGGAAYVGIYEKCSSSSDCTNSIGSI